MSSEVSKVITKVRNKVPLVQCITNYVTINDCANIILAYGGSPAMCEAYDEVYDFAAISSAVYINVGTLTKEQENSVMLADMSCRENNVPVILDPVGCGPAMKKKNMFISRLLEIGKVDVIKGNTGEIKFLAGKDSAIRGVDSIDNGEGAVEACRELAQKYNCVVAATGKKDVITDGKRTAIIRNGVELLTKVTGSGCMVGALCGATIGAEEDKFIATCAAILAMDIASEGAYKESQYPGTFRVKLIDNIYALTEEKLMKGGNIEWL